MKAVIICVVLTGMLASFPADAALRVSKVYQGSMKAAVQASEGGLSQHKATMPNGCKNRNGPPPCFKELLSCFSWFATYYKYNWRITDGTLLGQQRNGNFIPWDDDLDVSMDTSGNRNRLDYSIIEKFKKEQQTGSKAFNDAQCGKVAWIQNHTTHPATYMRMIHKDCKHCEWKNEKQWLDIDNDWDIRATEPYGSDRRKITKEMIYPTYNCKLEGIWVKCPASPWKYLDLYYGKTWKRPMFTTFSNGEWQANPEVLAENKKREDEGAKSAAAAAAKDPTSSKVIPSL